MFLNYAKQIIIQGFIANLVLCIAIQASTLPKSGPVAECIEASIPLPFVLLQLIKTYVEGGFELKMRKKVSEGIGSRVDKISILSRKTFALCYNHYPPDYTNTTVDMFTMQRLKDIPGPVAWPNCVTKMDNDNIFFSLETYVPKGESINVLQEKLRNAFSKPLKAANYSMAFSGDEVSFILYNRMSRRLRLFEQMDF